MIGTKGVDNMDISFGESLRQLRIEKGISQQQLADILFVSRSSVASWETGRRLPDLETISRLSEFLGADVGSLLRAAEKNAQRPKVLLVDDEKLILSGGLPVLEEVMPGADINGFNKPSEALEYARSNKVALAFLDIEMGKVSGLELCRALLEINPVTNVIFLTAYMEYSFDAWSTGASGFMLKPISPDAVRRQLELLRYPVRGLE